VAFVENDGGFVDCVGNDASNTCDLGRCQTPSQSIRQQRRPQTSALPFRINGKATDQ
jgi:hypothetical protein